MSSAYYNEHDRHAAAWLRQLVARNLIAPGDVDERSIVDVRPADLAGYTQCHFFAGIATWSYALRRAGWSDDRPVWTGSPPCQPFSTAGKQLGGADERHLAPVFLDLVRECRPSVLFGEQVASAASGSHGWWADDLRANLEREGYAFGMAVLGAHSVGAPHIRQRLYFMADNEQRGCEGWGVGLAASGAVEPPKDGGVRSPLYGFWRDAVWLPCRDGKWRPTGRGISPLVGKPQPRPLALADGTPGGVGHCGDCGVPGAQGGEEVLNTAEARVMRIKGYGNGIVAPLAQMFIECAMDAMANTTPAEGRDQQ